MRSVEELVAALPLPDVTGVVLAAYPFDQEWVGNEGVLSPEFFAEHLPGAVLLRFAGHVDEAALSKHDVACYPEAVPRGHMGTLLSDLGPDSVVQLQAGGLKAAEVALACWWTARRTSPDPARLTAATRAALRQALELGRS